MALTIGELVGLIRADDSGMRRGLSDAELRMAGFARDTNGRLRDLHGRFVDETETMSRLLGGMADDAGPGMRRGLTAAQLHLAGFQRDAAGRLRDIHGRFVTESEAMARALADNLGDGANRGLRTLADHVRTTLSRIRSDADEQARSLFSRLPTLGRQAGDDTGDATGNGMLRTFASTVLSGISAAWSTGMSGLSGVAESLQSNPYIRGIGTAMAVGVIATALPLIGALLSGAVIAVGGLAIIGIGAALLKDEPEVKRAAGKLSDTVKGVFQDAAQHLKEPIVKALGDLEQTAKDIAPQIDEAFKKVAESGGIKSLTDGIDKLVKNALPGFLEMLDEMGPTFEGLEELLSDIGTGLGNFFEQIGRGGPGAKRAFEDLGTAIAFMLTVVGKVFGDLATAYGYVRNFISDVIDVFQWLSDVLVGHSIVPDMVTAIVAVFAGLPRRAVQALASLGSRIAGAASSALRSMNSRVSDGIATGVSYLRGLPGRARSALGDVGGVLAAAGRSLISGFINGIQSMIGSVRDAASNVVSAARDFFPFSPAKEGPFSGRGYTLYSGRALIEGFQTGIDDQLPQLRATLQKLSKGMPEMGVPGFGMAGAGALPGGSYVGLPQQRVKVDIELSGPEAVTRLIRQIVADTGGGDVQATFGRGKR